MARAELAGGDPEAAQRSLEEAVARSPFDPVLWRELGSAAIELGTEIAHGDGALVRPYLRAGVTAYDDTEVTRAASFAGAPAGRPNFPSLCPTSFWPE